MSNTRLVIVGGFDPSAGAGVLSDYTFAKVWTENIESILTCTTLQRANSFQSLRALPTDDFQASLNWVEWEHTQVLKTGAMGSFENLEALCEKLRSLGAIAPRWWILDPVRLATSGGILMHDSAASKPNYWKYLASIFADLNTTHIVLTPNRSEGLEMMKSFNLSRSDMRQASLERWSELALQCIKALNLKGLLIKSFRVSDESIEDLWVDPKGEYRSYSQTRRQVDAHGTGCAYASSIAGALTSKLAIEDSIEQAHRMMQKALKESESSTHKGRVNLQQPSPTLRNRINTKAGWSEDGG